VPTWTVTLEADPAEAEDVAAALVEEGATGVEVRDGEALPMPGAPRAPEGRAVLIAWFADRSQADAASRGRRGAVAEVPDEDWGETWKKGLGPLRVGRAWVRPSWIAAPPPEGLVEIVLDPGMAFGTGTHPTTALCLEALSELLEAQPGADVLDVGTGSGLLAIAAAKLGAGRVAANDVDPVALRVAAENAALNGVSIELTAAPAGAVAGTFDVVVANILANTLVELAHGIAARLSRDGVLLLAGILAPQEDEVRAAYLAEGLAPVAGGDRRHGEWSLLALRRPGPAAGGGAR
jgi:ribosomal protein L11 methyltransferase